MPRQKNSCTPAYRRHRPSDRAVVTFDGSDFYLGPWNTKASKLEYDRLVSEWLANGRCMPSASSDRHAAPGDYMVMELARDYLRFAEQYYVKDDEQTSEVCCMRCALGYVARLYGHTAASQFGPLAIKAVREAMIEAGLSRNTTNGYVARIKMAFKWAVSNERVPANVYHGLTTVTGLRRGRSEARETEPVQPVPESMVDTILPFLSSQARAMVELMKITGMRAGEVTIMRACDIDMTGPVWQYRPEVHKTMHYGKQRVISLGPKAQEIIRPFLKLDLGAYLFSATDAVAEHRAEQRRNRKTKVQPSQRNRRKRNPKRKPGDHFTTDAIRRSIANACDAAYPLPEPLCKREDETYTEWQARLTDEQKAELAAWRKAHRFHPHQLRHLAATKLRKQFGIEAARIILGHSTMAVTEVYAEIDQAKASEIAEKTG